MTSVPTGIRFFRATEQAKDAGCPRIAIDLDGTYENNSPNDEKVTAEEARKELGSENIDKWTKILNFGIGE